MLLDPRLHVSEVESLPGIPAKCIGCQVSSWPSDRMFRGLGILDPGGTQDGFALSDSMFRRLGGLP